VTDGRLQSNRSGTPGRRRRLLLQVDANTMDAGIERDTARRCQSSGNPHDARGATKLTRQAAERDALAHVCTSASLGSLQATHSLAAKCNALCHASERAPGTACMVNLQGALVTGQIQHGGSPSGHQHGLRTSYIHAQSPRFSRAARNVARASTDGSYGHPFSIQRGSIGIRRARADCLLFLIAMLDAISCARRCLAPQVGRSRAAQGVASSWRPTQHDR
jgi:hypothetical protein